MLNTTQINWVINQLVKDGRITRNQCLKRYITRLSAIIYKLKEIGWDFKAGYDENKNYLYVVSRKPKKVEHL